ncbi:MAG: RagB/SusD family nutrient uptake outer membrane protein [Chitinophagales bacterium]|nr:RagB/SusD family nutrient uptake outer membrane protein [Chitinophagales bacterium]
MKQFTILCLISNFIFTFPLTSCKKYLEEKPDKKLVELKTLDDLEALLDDNSLINKETTPGFGETSADDYFLQLSDYNSLTDFDKSLYTWRPAEYKFNNDWAVGYLGIYSANYCLDYVDNIQRTPANLIQWDNVKGSALFHRAYRYLNLIWIYGKAYDQTTSQLDLGVVLRLNSDPSMPSVRASVKECYERVITDAKEAALFLPNTPQHVMRPSKAAAFGLLARAYLSMRMYDSAYKYSNQALQIKNDLLDFNDPSVDPFSMPPFQPFNKEIIFYTTQTQFYWPKNPYIALIDTLLYNSYDDNDLRKTAFFYENFGFHAFQGTYSTDDIEDLFTGIATDELYLIRAECHARATPVRISDAMNDLNILLSKRWATGTFIPHTATNQQLALALVLTERRKELLMRGLRWIDIKRFNKEGADITLKRIADQVYTLPPNDSRYALPIPKDIIDITGMPQN